LLEREGHRVVTATSGREALDIMRNQKIDLLLLDFYMPQMTGEQVVSELRQFNRYIQVILQTGYASEQPPRELLRRLDIQGYYDKGQGPDQLLLWTTVGLKAAYMIQLLFKSRQGLRYILDVTPDLHKIQSLAELLQGVLLQVTGFIGAADSFLAVLPESAPLGGFAEGGADGFLAIVEHDAELVVRASTGRFAFGESVETCLTSERIHLVQMAVQQGTIQIEEGATVVPLRITDAPLGVIYLDRAASVEQDIELLQIFANQAAVAIQNAQLYEMATVDPLTGVYQRRVFEQWLQRELRAALRTRQPLALLVVDLDGMKRINDTGGHLAGDQALALVGQKLRDAVRKSDIVGRYGGDEFAVVLPQTSLERAESVAQRILQSMEGRTVAGSNGPLSVRISVGLSILSPKDSTVDLPRPAPPSYFQEAAKQLIQNADEALYRSKREGGGKIAEGRQSNWPPSASGTAAESVTEPPSETGNERS
jgi:diguanylate cyclase (GGDEF)-like protein